MTNEIIFKYCYSYRGRWGDLHDIDTVILADFSNMSKWPYQIKVEESVSDSLDEEDDTTSTKFYKISKNLFENIKSTIARHSELKSLPENIDYVMVMDGGSQYFEFICPAFKKIVHGNSLLSIGSYEIEKNPSCQNHCAVLYRVYADIKKLVDTEQSGLL